LAGDGEREELPSFRRGPARRPQTRRAHRPPLQSPRPQPQIRTLPCPWLRDGGLASVVHRDLRDVDSLLADPGIKDALDFGRPIAVLLVAVLHFIRDEEEPARIVQALRDAMPPGSYLVISHGTQDFNPARATAAVRGYD
jgi:hypothetical protein